MWLLLSHPAFAQWAVAPIGDDPPAADAPTRWNSSFLHADDLDGDGYPEVLASDSLEDDLSTFPSVDGWAYGPRLSLPNAVNDLVDGSDVNTGDFDGDGDLDLVVHASVFRNDGRFTYTYDGILPRPTSCGRPTSTATERSTWSAAAKGTTPSIGTRTPTARFGRASSSCPTRATTSPSTGSRWATSTRTVT